MPIFGHSKFLPAFLYQKGVNKFGMCIFGHSEFIRLFGENCQKKFGTAIFGHSEFFGMADNFSVHIILIECNGLESNEIYTFLDFNKEI